MHSEQEFGQHLKQSVRLESINTSVGEYNLALVMSSSGRLQLSSPRRVLGLIVRDLMVSEASEPLFRAGLTAPPERVKAVNPHSNSLEPFSDVVPCSIVGLTAQFTASKGSQIAASINEKH